MNRGRASSHLVFTICKGATMSRSHHRRLSTILGAAASVFGLSTGALAANVAIILPLHRVAYQSNEWIDVSVVRADAAALPASDLVLTVTGDDASKLAFTFPVKAVAVQGKDS